MINHLYTVADPLPVLPEQYAPFRDLLRYLAKLGPQRVVSLRERIARGPCPDEPHAELIEAGRLPDAPPLAHADRPRQTGLHAGAVMSPTIDLPDASPLDKYIRALHLAAVASRDAGRHDDARLSELEVRHAREMGEALDQSIARSLLMNMDVDSPHYAGAVARVTEIGLDLRKWQGSTQTRGLLLPQARYLARLYRDLRKHRRAALRAPGHGDTRQRDNHPVERWCSFCAGWSEARSLADSINCAKCGQSWAYDPYTGTDRLTTDHSEESC